MAEDPNSLRGIGIGRIVHYVVDASTLRFTLCDKGHVGQHLPALVTAVSEKWAVAHLTIFPPGGIGSGLSRQVAVTKDNVKFDPNQGEGTWHWPERDDA